MDGGVTDQYWTEDGGKGAVASPLFRQGVTHRRPLGLLQHPVACPEVYHSRLQHLQERERESEIITKYYQMQIIKYLTLFVKYYVSAVRELRVQ